MMWQLTLFLLPVAATCGWWVGRRSPQNKAATVSQQIRHNYFRGLNYLINEEPDKALDVFIKLLEVDSDTVETHLALGNLFRRRGEVERAIRVHQNLIARPQLPHEYRVQALFALGEDYLRAGVLDRAERLFLELVQMGADHEHSLRFLLHIYQQEKDWHKAIEIAHKLQSINGESKSPSIAHYYCELAQIDEKNNPQLSQQYLKKAQSIDKNCVRASILLAESAVRADDLQEAIRFYMRVREQDPGFISEVIEPLHVCYRKIQSENKYIDYLEECLKKYPRIALVIALAEHKRHVDGDKAAINFMAQHIEQRPSLRGLSHLISLYLNNSSGDTQEKLKILKKLLDTLLAEKPVYQCLHCGFSGKTLFWLCPSCHSWNTIKPILGLEGD